MDKLWDIYLNLPRESFTLMLKNLEIMDKMFSSWRGVSSGSETALWPEYMSGIYSEMFKMFFYPLEIITGRKLTESQQEYPKDFLEAYLKLITTLPSKDVMSYFNRILECYLQFFKAWYDFNLKINEVGLSVFKRLIQEGSSSKSSSEPKDDKTELFTKWQNMWTDMYKNWLGSPQKYFGFPFNLEDVFLLPKEAVEALYKSGESYLELQKSWVEYSNKLFSSWQQAMQKFTDEITKKASSSNPGPYSLTFREFFETWMNSFTNVFDSMLTSTDYVQAQAKMIGHLTDFVKHQQEFYEAYLSANPILPFVYRTEGDIYGQRYFLLNRKVKELEKKSDEFMIYLEEFKNELKNVAKKKDSEKKGEGAEEKNQGNN